MLIKRPNDIPPSEITPETIYRQRRRFMQSVVKTTVATTVGITMPTLFSSTTAAGVLPANSQSEAIDFPRLKTSLLSTDEDQTPFKKIKNYANFYEFGTGKADPKAHAHTLKPRPWSIPVVGEVEKPQMFDIEDILTKFTLEERIYRLRCVEGWSMVIPWVGFPLRDLIKRAQPTARAKFIQFITLHDTQQMPGQKSPVLDWPYQEGLRIDEAMHPLTILSVGLYGQLLPNENGAPLRLVVPWKYGFKSIKSIVKIRFVEQQPSTSWEQYASDVYGFYANVNPDVPHPRWSQKKERRIGEFFKRKTLMFNGYGEQVAALYNNMDLRKYY